MKSDEGPDSFLNVFYHFASQEAISSRHPSAWQVIFKIASNNLNELFVNQLARLASNRTDFLEIMLSQFEVFYDILKRHQKLPLFEQ